MVVEDAVDEVGDVAPRVTFDDFTIFCFPFPAIMGTGDGSTFGDIGGADEEEDADEEEEADDRDEAFVDELVDETLLADSAALFLTIRLIDDTEGRLS